MSPEQIWSGNETGVQNVPKEDKFLGEVKKPLVNQVPADQGECMILVPVIVLYLCCTLVSTLNSTEFHLQGVAPRSQ